MLDIVKFRSHPDVVRESLISRGVNKELFDNILKADEQIRHLKREIESVSARKNQASKLIPGLKAKERESLLATMRELDQQEAALREKLLEANKQYTLDQLPNIPFDDVPRGAGEEGNVVIKTEGGIPAFSFEPKDHLVLGSNLGIIDMERAAKVSGSRFGYLIGDAVLLEFALIAYVYRTLSDRSFTPIIPPILVNETSMWGVGHATGADANEKYHAKDDPLFLVGSAEHSLIPMYSDEILEPGVLPQRALGFSTAMRREAGSYGKDTRGIFRVHQFDKLEMVSWCKAGDSVSEHHQFLSFQEEIVRGLKLPYRVMNICTGDLEFPAAARFDIEVWFPSQNSYRETHSTSNCTDFQSRRLNIRYREGNNLAYAHTVNGTACAIGRTIAAILENYQNADGSVRVPDVLRPFMNGTHVLSASTQ